MEFLPLFILNPMGARADREEKRIRMDADREERTAATEEARKQSLALSADAFRGVHLDPKAQHWDEVRCTLPPGRKRLIKSSFISQTRWVTKETTF